MKALFDPAFRTEAEGAAAPVAPSRYRRNRTQDPIATFGALALVAGSAAAFMLVSPQVVRKEVKAPVVVELMALPDDPPPAEHPEVKLDAPPPPPSQLTAPPPQIVLPPQPAALAAPPALETPPPPAPARAAAPAAAPRATGPMQGGDLSAGLLEGRPPRYPIESRRNKEQGTVVLNLLLATDGRVAEVSIARSSGFPRLDRAALEAVRGWRWSPTLRDGEPVMVRGVYKLDFFIQGGDRRGPRGRHDRDRHEERGHDGPAEGVSET